jgi:hypothetical protein
MRVCRGNGAVQIAVRKRVSGRVALLPYGQVTAVPRTRQYVRTKRSMLAADHGRGMFRVRSGRQGCDGLVASGTEERVAKLMRRLDAASGVREQTGERASRMPAGYFLGAAQIWAQSVLCRASFPSSPAFDIIHSVCSCAAHSTSTGHQHRRETDRHSQGSSTAQPRLLLTIIQVPKMHVLAPLNPGTGEGHGKNVAKATPQAANQRIVTVL